MLVWRYTFDWFLTILGSIKIKFCQILVQLLTNMSLDVRSSTLNHGKPFLKVLLMIISISWSRFMSKGRKIQKKLKMCSTSCACLCHDVINFEIDGMVWNIKNWRSHEENLSFPKLPKVCLKEHNFRSYIKFKRRQSLTW